MNKQNYFTVGALVCAVLALGIIGYTVRAPVVNVNPVIQDSEQVFQAVPGPEVSGDCFSVGGSQRCIIKSPFNYGTTTVACAVRSPAATSTLMGFTFQTTTATATDAYYAIGTTTSNRLTGQHATSSTMVDGYSVTPTITETISWLPNEDVINGNVIPAGTWITVGFDTGSVAVKNLYPNGYQIRGFCQGEFWLTY